jgi:hypothetical protein
MSERVPLCNRVSPLGDIVSVDARGTLWGNRGGCLHDAEGHILRTHTSKAWITCVLEFKGWWRPVMTPGTFTELFFLDEATALAAGHRPCYLCRRADAVAFADAFAAGAGTAGPLRAPAMDAVLHPLRRPTGPHRPTWRARARDLPDGTIVRRDDGEWLVSERALRRWSFVGYGAPERLPSGSLAVLTPEPTVRAIAAGYDVALHPTAM